MDIEDADNSKLRALAMLADPNATEEQWLDALEKTKEQKPQTKIKLSGCFAALNLCRRLALLSASSIILLIIVSSVRPDTYSGVIVSIPIGSALGLVFRRCSLIQKSVPLTIFIVPLWNKLWSIVETIPLNCNPCEIVGSYACYHLLIEVIFVLWGIFGLTSFFVAQEFANKFENSRLARAFAKLKPIKIHASSSHESEVLNS